MSYVKLWVHAVWATKDAEPILTKPIRMKLFRYMREYSIEKQIRLDFINGYVEHVHCTISLQADQRLVDVIQLLKGGSSFWLNNQNLIEGKFRWQKEYYAVSVSESLINKVRDYIKHQEQHHRKKSFADEEKEMVKKFGFVKALE